MDEAELPENSPEEWEMVKDLLVQWETDHPADLDAWLAEHCPTASIRNEVERLARASATSGKFLEGSAAEEHLGVPAPHPVRIGRFRIIEELGSGGLGTVYAAYDPSLERKVAIKVLSSKMAGEADRRKRLRWDAKAACSAKHPNIVTIYDIGSANGSDFIVMECVEGLTLSQAIDPGGLPPQIALRYALQIADALAAAHSGNIIHRDLKPNNIMITAEGVVKVLDFGLAKDDNPEAEHTSLPATIEGHFAGTVSYVSPEQAEGKAVDNRADIFSFGCILFEMLTGKRAFDGGNAVSILGNILHQRAPQLRRHAPQIDERFGTIIDRCLCKKPEERYPNMEEVKARLEELQEVEASPSRLSYRMRKHLTIWGLSAAATILLAVVVLEVTRFAFQQRWPTRQPQQQVATNDSGLSTMPAVSRDGKWLAYASDRDQRANLDIWVQSWDRSGARRLTTDPADESGPSFNATGSTIVFRSEKDGGGLYTVPFLGGTPELIAAQGRDGRYSPDGRWLAYWTGEVGASLHRGCATAYRVRAEGGQREELISGFEATAYPVWSTTGQQLIFLGRRAGDAAADWWVKDLRDGSVHVTGIIQKLRKINVRGPRGGYFPVVRAWLGDQTVLFSVGFDDATNIWAARIAPDGRIGEPAHPWSNGTEAEVYPDAADTPASTHVVYGAERSATAIWRIPLAQSGKSAAPPERVLGGLRRIGSPSVNWIGDKLTFVAQPASVETIETAGFADGRLTAPSNSRLIASMHRVVLSGDGSTVAWLNGTKGYMKKESEANAREVCAGCSIPTYLSFDGTKAIFEGGGTSDELIYCAPGQKARKLVQVSAGSWQQTAGKLSPGERWMVFSGWREGESTRHIIVAPVTPDGAVAESQLIAITSGESLNREPVWSTDGRRIYFLSDRDGSYCVWARDFSPEKGVAEGPPYEVAHFGFAGLAVRGPGPSWGTIGLSAAKDFLVLTLTETTGNIWMRSVAP